jgi:hypothetical protein
VITFVCRGFNHHFSFAYRNCHQGFKPFALPVAVKFTGCHQLL